jgi:pimeloyl-ACP methyl ester carboxylesterase
VWPPGGRALDTSIWSPLMKRLKRYCFNIIALLTVAAVVPAPARSEQCVMDFTISVPGAGSDEGDDFHDWIETLPIHQPATIFPYDRSDRIEDSADKLCQLIADARAAAAASGCYARVFVVGHSQGGLITGVAASRCGADDVRFVSVDPAQWGSPSGWNPFKELFYGVACAFYPASCGIREGSPEHQAMINALYGQSCGYFPRLNPDGTPMDSDDEDFDPDTGVPHNPFDPVDRDDSKPIDDFLDAIERCIERLWEELHPPMSIDWSERWHGSQIAVD